MIPPPPRKSHSHAVEDIDNEFQQLEVLGKTFKITHFCIEIISFRMKVRKINLLPFIFMTILENLSKGVRQEKEMPGIEIENEDVKLLLFTDGMNKHKANSVAS